MPSTLPSAEDEATVTPMASMADLATAYTGGRARIIELVADLDEEEATTIVPGCPDWTVKDVVSHVTGICSDILAGNIDGVATDPWTKAQVDARRPLPLSQIVAEWREVGPQVEAMLPSFPPEPAAQLVGDLTTHEHDVRGALGRPGARDSDAIAIGLEFVASNFVTEVAGRALPALSVRAGDSEWVDAGARPVVSVSADRFELVRALTGRRSASQLRRLKWDGDPEPYLPAFDWGPFHVRASDLVE
jgi:uncharacterized protein (TIGR03083 family)